MKNLRSIGKVTTRWHCSLDWLLQAILLFILGLGLVAGWSRIVLAVPIPPVASIPITIKVYADQSLGESTQYIGACEGNVRFEITDMVDLGINTYRIYGGMSRWETEDDDQVYGFPTIAQIKADPNVIAWEHWDQAMTAPKSGTDYAFSGRPEDLWQGSARTIFEKLKQSHIRPVVTIRNVDNNWNPEWALQLNPPRTEADWNEWWEHVFATVYWLNVRNNYQIDDFEIHNEPDDRGQGWGGSQQDYFKLVQVAQDAIDFVYTTYLPNRTYAIHAPVTVGGSRWVEDALQAIPTYFDNINIHDYAEDISAYTQQVRQWMQGTIHANSPIWMGEWGTYTTGYDDLAFSLNLLKNLIRMSEPGPSHIYGSLIFSLYDWGRDGNSPGLIDAKSNRRLSYYALRMGIRALQGGKPVLLTEFGSAPNLSAIATENSDESINLLIVNDGRESYNLTADTSAVVVKGRGTVWQFNQQVKDEMIASRLIEAGRLLIHIPSQSAVLVQVSSS